MHRKKADNYNHQSAWQKLYLATKKWKDDLLFYRQDLRFVQLVLIRYFLSKPNIENVALQPDKEIKMNHLYRYCDTLIQETDYHIKELSKLIKDPFKQDYKDFKRENKYLKDDIAHFAKTLRRVRKDVFQITESVLEGERLFPALRLNHTLNLEQAEASA